MKARESSWVSGGGVRALAGIAALLAALVAFAGQVVPSIADWPMLGRTSDHASTTWAAPGSLGSPRWVLQQHQGHAIEFAGQAGVVLFAGHVFATGYIENNFYLMSVDAESGGVEWTTPVDPPQMDSWSTPAVDAANGTVLVGSGLRLTACRMTDGRPVWQTELSGPVVNASVTLTGPRGGRARAIVTCAPYYPFLSQTYCVNVDPYSPGTNPYQPGEVVWTGEVGSAYGSSAAYAEDRVYVTAATDGQGGGSGRVLCFPIDQIGAYAIPAWVTTLPEEEGFFGGISLRRLPGRVDLFAATYDFYGPTLLSSHLVKLDGTSGAIVWTAASNRTSSTPIPLADGRVVLSGGIMPSPQSPCSVVWPSVQMFRDDGASVVRLWDTALDTWVDANGNGCMDLGEFLLVGGWTQVPAVAGAADSVKLLVGELPPGEDGFGACVRLRLLDLNREPSQAGFVVGVAEGAGSTPAMGGAGVYTVGTLGLSAFGPPPPRFDVNGDGDVDVDDLASWERGLGARDVDRDVVVGASDRAALMRELRRSMHHMLISGRP